MRLPGWTGAQGYRWRRAADGRVPPPPRVVDGRYLSLKERLQIANLHLAGHGVRVIASALGRAPSTVSRELTRGGVRTQGPGRPRPSSTRKAYAPYAAHQRAAVSARRPKVARPADPVVGAELTDYVTEKMDLRWSPQQISASLRELHPDRQDLRVSPETVYQSLYVQGRGHLRVDLNKQLASAAIRIIPWGLRSRVQGEGQVSLPPTRSTRRNRASKSRLMGRQVERESAVTHGCRGPPVRAGSGSVTR